VPVFSIKGAWDEKKRKEKKRKEKKTQIQGRGGKEDKKIK
jgi:hypothetical protein